MASGDPFEKALRNRAAKDERDRSNDLVRRQRKQVEQEAILSLLGALEQWQSRLQSLGLKYELGRSTIRSKSDKCIILRLKKNPSGLRSYTTSNIVTASVEESTGRCKFSVQGDIDSDGEHTWHRSEELGSDVTAAVEKIVDSLITHEELPTGSYGYPPYEFWISEAQLQTRKLLWIILPMAVVILIVIALLSSP